jgi:hypothetical protein
MRSMKSPKHIVRRFACCIGLLAVLSTVSAATTNDFSTVCAQSGIIKCVSFDTDADFSTGKGGTQGAWGANSGILPPSGSSDYSRATRDATVMASGASSLRFTIPSNTGSDTSGAWFTNFSNDLSVQMGEGGEVYVQWRQRFSPEYLGTQYTGVNQPLGNGWKLADVSAGDLPGCSLNSASTANCSTTCWDFTVVAQNTNQVGIPQLYTNCAGQWVYWPLQGYTTAPTVQNAVNCLYPTYASPPCVKLQSNEWMTFQIRIKVGHWNTWDSTIQMWVAREGQPSTLVIDCSSTATNKCVNGVDSAASNGWYLVNSNTAFKFGKVWLLPYHTKKDPTQVTPTAYTWYDNLIISHSKIPDPSGSPVVKPNSPTNLKAL